jgi:subtilisin family serine protease
LALSASFAGDWVMEAFSQGICSPHTAGPAPWDAPSAPWETASPINGPFNGPFAGQDPAVHTTGAIDPASSPASSPGNPAGAVFSPLEAAKAIRDQYGFDGGGQTIAVIDTGIAWDHVAFSTPQPGGKPLVGYGVGYRVVGGWDFAENDALPYDDGPSGYHGTHVAGIVAGASGDFAGVAPGADLVSLRVFDDFGMGKLSWVESALRWVIDNRTALENPITTVNLSLGAFAEASTAAFDLLNDELEQLRSAGVTVVAAAGNSFNATRPDSLAYPASHPLVAAVSSVDASGNLHGFSQRADGVFAAPGGTVVSSIPEHVNGWTGRNDDFGPASGTSMASPQLAGATMLVRQAMESIGETPTPDSILDHLRETSQTATDPATGATFHRIDLRAAIDVLVNGSTDNPEGEPSGGNAHLVWTDPRTLVVNGTSDSNTITVDLSTGVRITVDSVVYGIDRPLDNLVIQGGAGTNSLEIIGGDGIDRVIMRAAVGSGDSPGGELTNARMAAEFNGFQNIRFVGGGNDRVTMFDSAGNDTFESSQNAASLRGAGFTFVAENAPNVFAHGSAGGLDTAYLYDTAGDDTLAIRHQFTSMRGDAMFRLAYGFERVYAFATAGGYDQAALYDSPGDDTLSASPSAAWISSRDYYAGARGFDVIRAESSMGGNDIARLYAADGSAEWARSGSLLQMTDPSGQSRSAQGFSRAEGYVGTRPMDIIPQSVRDAFYEDERAALRELFADFGDEQAS